MHRFQEAIMEVRMMPLDPLVRILDLDTLLAELTALRGS